jgi:hypothetical protein
VELLEPLAVLHVALAAGDGFDVTGVDELHLEAPGLKDLEERDPVDPRGLHGDGVDPTLLEPIGQPLEIGGEALKAAHGLRIAVRGDGD